MLLEGHRRGLNSEAFIPGCEQHVNFVIFGIQCQRNRFQELSYRQTEGLVRLAEVFDARDPHESWLAHDSV